MITVTIMGLDKLTTGNYCEKHNGRLTIELKQSGQ